ncbi:MAG: hypothetical protein HY658_10965 [Actinobacteria bacterium]|nr:hypothetical protein [Actinomycetota bacterium]
MAKTAHGIEYGTPHTGKGAVRRGTTGRACAHPGCTTILSTYNEASTCWMHSPSAFRGAKDAS